VLAIGEEGRNEASVTRFTKTDGEPPSFDHLGFHFD
jgi:hypothetical protein